MHVIILPDYRRGLPNYSFKFDEYDNLIELSYDAVSEKRYKCNCTYDRNGVMLTYNDTNGNWWDKEKFNSPFIYPKEFISFKLKFIRYHHNRNGTINAVEGHPSIEGWEFLHDRISNDQVTSFNVVFVKNGDTRIKGKHSRVRTFKLDDYYLNSESRAKVTIEFMKINA